MQNDSQNGKIENIKQSLIKAGEIGLKHFRKHQIEVSQKSTIYEIVTPQDLEMENLIKEEIGKNFPEDLILAEESPERVGKSFWTVDPLDGTSYYQRGLTDWSINVARVETGEVVIAMTYCPTTNEFFYSRKRQGAYLNGNKIQVSEVAKLKEGILFFGHNYLRKYNDEKSVDLRVNVRNVWSTGSTALALANLAAGRIDIGIQTNQSFWDITGMLHVIEAGGKFTSWQNNIDFDLTGKKVNNFLATNGRLHSAVLDFFPPSNRS